MSYNNCLNSDVAWNCVSEFRNPTCVIVNHRNPCGVASRQGILEAYRLAVRADPASAFGGIIAFNTTVDEDLAKEIREFRCPTDGSTYPNSAASARIWVDDPEGFSSWNLSASGPRPNPQGSYHYGMINTTRTIRLANSAPIIDGKQRYAVNSASFVPADTPLKLADYYNIPGVFALGSIPDGPTSGTGVGVSLQTSVMPANFRDYVEIIFENDEDFVQSWHFDGYFFFVVGMDVGQWTSESRQSYNLRDTIARCTVQVYPKSWTAVYVALDNVGMWNIRSENWGRQYLGQQLYLRVFSPANSSRDEYPIPTNALLCGRATAH